MIKNPLGYNQWFGVTAFQRFVEKIDYDPKTDCWLWKGNYVGNYVGNRYGRFRVNGKRILVHRWTYEYFIGPIPESLELDHLCRTTLCVNPFHVEPVSHRQNILRCESCWSGVNARKTHCLRGHPLNGKNLYVTPRGGRSCRACAKVHRLKWWRKHRGKRAKPRPLAA